MKNILKITLSTALLASTSLMTINAVAACNGSTPSCTLSISANTTLTSDCKGPIAVTGNNLTLNLGGHTVCNSASHGIHVTGNRVTIKNGYLKKHATIGIIMSGNKGRIENINITKHLGAYPIRITGRKATVINSNIHDNPGATGVALNIRSTARYASVTNNTMNHNGWGGIFTAAKSGNYWLNHTNLNDAYGISVWSNAKNNNIYFNTALYNAGGIDVYESNACGSNSWNFNTFGTKSKTCIN